MLGAGKGFGQGQLREPWQGAGRWERQTSSSGMETSFLPRLYCSKVCARLLTHPNLPSPGVWTSTSGWIFEMTVWVFVSATSGRGAVQTHVGGNIFKLQLNPQQLMSQGCDSQAETTWHEGQAAPAPAACPECLPCLDTGCTHPALPVEPVGSCAAAGASCSRLATAASARASSSSAGRGDMCHFCGQDCINYWQCGLETHVSSKSSKLCFQS